jgi:hypothetical protein
MRLSDDGTITLTVEDARRMDVLLALSQHALRDPGIYAAEDATRFAGDWQALDRDLNGTETTQ